MCADSMTNCNNPFSASTVHPLNVDIVVERILSILDEDHDDLIKYRLVCHKWNDLIVRKINKTGRSFKIPLRYESHVPQFIDVSVARQRAMEVLDTAVSTLTGTAARLHFDSLIIDRDFYLAGVMLEFTKFLEIQGQSILHLKIKIRPEKRPKKNENRIMGCTEVVTMENIYDLFYCTPNLESLNFGVRFSPFNYGVKNPMGVGEIMQDNLYSMIILPQLKKLTRLKIKEPEGFQYSVELFRKLMSTTSLSSNLKKLEIKSTKQLSSFALALKHMEPFLRDSLTELYITNPRIDAVYLSFSNFTRITEFSYFPFLSKLSLNKISGAEKFNWIRLLFFDHQWHQSSLKVLVLGQRKSNNGEGEDWNSGLGDDDFAYSLFPPVMENIEHLEINLTEFNVSYHVRVDSYGTQFPRLKTLRITGYEEQKWTWIRLYDFLPGADGESQTVQEFCLIGDIDTEDDRISIVCDASATFPRAHIRLDD